jgi:hypothetical protein
MPACDGSERLARNTGDCAFGEDEAFEGAGGPFGDGAKGADEVHVATELEAFDGDDADRPQLEFLLDGPLGDEAGAEAGFDGGDDGDYGVEVHGDAEVAKAQPSAAQGELDDVARAGAALSHDEGNFSEGADGDGDFGGARLMGPGIAAPDDEDHAILKEALAEDFAAGDGAFDEAEVNLALRESFDDVFGVGAGDGGLDARMLIEKRAEHAGKDVLCNGHGGADAEGAGGFAAEAIEGGAGFIGEASAFAGIAEEDGAGVGEANAAFAAVEQGGGQLFFEGANLLAHRRLAEVETLGRAAKAGFFGDGAKDAKPEILHSVAPLSASFLFSLFCLISYAL